MSLLTCVGLLELAVGRLPLLLRELLRELLVDPLEGGGDGVVVHNRWKCNKIINHCGIKPSTAPPRTPGCCSC